jgi:hypothetical protein
MIAEARIMLVYGRGGNGLMVEVAGGACTLEELVKQLARV